MARPVRLHFREHRNNISQRVSLLRQGLNGAKNVPWCSLVERLRRQVGNPVDRFAVQQASPPTGTSLRLQARGNGADFTHLRPRFSAWYLPESTFSKFDAFTSQPRSSASECAGFSGQKIAVGHEGKVPVEPRDPILRGTLPICSPTRCPRSCLPSHPPPATAWPCRFAASEKRTSHVRRSGRCFCSCRSACQTGKAGTPSSVRHRSVSQKPTKALARSFKGIRIQ